LEKKPSQTEKYRANQLGFGFCSKITEPKPVGLNLFWVFFKKNQFGYFLGKNQTEQKIITPIGNPTTKSIKMYSHFHSRISKCCNNRIGV
jgi:hypothetical protein